MEPGLTAQKENVMSHVATVQCQIKDLDALDAACKALQATLRQGQRTFRAYEGQVACDHAITLDDAPNAYGVGVAARRDGDGFDLKFDSWGYGKENGAPVVQRFGAGLTGLQNEYLATVAERQLRRQGYRVQRQVEAERQEIRLVAVR